MLSLVVTEFEDGRPRVSPDGLGGGRRRGQLPLLGNLAVILVGVTAVAVLLLADGEPAPVAAETTTTSVGRSATTVAPTTTSTVPPAETLRAVIPAVEGTLVTAVGKGPIHLVTWPATGRQTSSPIPMWDGPSVEFDRSGAYMAFLGAATAGEDSALNVGDIATWHALTVNANSFRWHARDAGRIGWTGGGLLCHGQVHPEGGFINLRCLVDIEGRLVGFDDTGFLVAVDSGDIVRLDPEGVEFARAPGVDAAIAPDGRILLISSSGDGGPPAHSFAVADPRLDRVTLLDWAPGGVSGEYGFVAWSPASSPPQLGFLVSTTNGEWQMQRWAIDGRLLSQAGVTGRYWNIEWDWTGRFLLSPGVDSEGRSVIQVYDTQTGEQHVLGADDWVQDVHLVRDVNAPVLFDLTSLVKGLPVK